MKNWIVLNKLIITGAIIGAIAGFLYWKYVGCLTGSCAITSHPVRSSVYFAFTGGLLMGVFKKKKNNKA